MNLYAVTAVYGTGRDAALFLAEDDGAAMAQAGRGYDPRGLGTGKTEVWLITADVRQVGELPAMPAELSWPAGVLPPELSELTATELLRRATGPGPSS